MARQQRWASGWAFGLGLGPCSFAFLAPLLMIVFGSASTDYLLAVGLLAAFAAGHCRCHRGHRHGRPEGAELGLLG